MPPSLDDSFLLVFFDLQFFESTQEATCHSSALPQCCCRNKLEVSAGGEDDAEEDLAWNWNWNWLEDANVLLLFVLFSSWVIIFDQKQTCTLPLLVLLLWRVVLHVVWLVLLCLSQSQTHSRTS